MNAEEPQFGVTGCTCIPWTRKYGMPRYCGPNETVADIGGWEPGRDCPHHQPAAAPSVPADADLRDRIAEAIWAQYPDAEPSRTGLVMANPHVIADAVLAEFPVLPEPRRPFDAQAGLQRLADAAQQAASSEDRCAECGHPKDEHEEGDDPVTPGQCAACDEDDDRHDFLPAN